MEIALDPEMKTYSGGLGILAGDLLYAGADLEIPIAGISLLNRKGYLHQILDPYGRQIEEAEPWDIEKYLSKQHPKIELALFGHSVSCIAWKYEITGVSGYRVPVYFLDTDIDENNEWDRKLTDRLYGDGNEYRIGQEMILGIGGVKMLRALGYDNLQRYHMNEGHSAFLGLELLDEIINQTDSPLNQDIIQKIRKKCVFTTHTPVTAGQDQFPLDLVSQALGNKEILEMEYLYTFEGQLNMTFLALNFCKFINGVSKLNTEIDELIFAPYKIEAITNGVHAIRWTSPPFLKLYDKHIPGWREDNFCLRYALGIPKDELWNAHMEAKTALINYVMEKTGIQLDKDIFTIGFARRATAYKRADLLFRDIEKLKSIAANIGPLQIILGGKAHPMDFEGKRIIEKLFSYMQALENQIKIVYLPNYEITDAQLITSGTDLWLNTPEPPLEASGTSGMKAALNGVPSLSVLDGWWNEGHIEGVTGWSIGKKIIPGKPVDISQDSHDLYQKLETLIIPKYYKDRESYINIMFHCIAINGSFFHAQRMMLQYDTIAY